MRNLRIVQVAAGILSLLFSFGVMTVFSACGQKEGAWMHCHTVQLNLCVLGMFIFALSMITSVLENRIVKIVLNGIGIVASIVVIIMPHVSKMCMMNTMHCHSVMKPFAGVMGGILLLVLLAACILTVLDLLKNKEKPATEQE